MFDPTEDGLEEARPAKYIQADHALRVGLSGLPVPEISPDFDQRIQAALLYRPARWKALWAISRPAFSTAACTFGFVLALLHFMPPVRSLPTASLAAVPPSAQSLPPRFEDREFAARAPEETVDTMDLRYASLSFLSHPLPHNANKRD